MCRQNQLWGLTLIAFGVGVLVGTWIAGAFFAHCMGIGLIFVGVCVVRRK